MSEQNTKPYDSWILDNDTNHWKAPLEYPTDGKFYAWDEASKSWKFCKLVEKVITT